MLTQLKMIQNDQAKGKSSVKSQGAIEELQYLLNFNQSISFKMAKTMLYLSDFVFVPYCLYVSVVNIQNVQT